MDKKYINYKKEWIKKDLKNNMPFITDPNQKLLFVDQQLEKLYNIGIDDDDAKILNNIIKYRQEQKALEDELEKPQRKMIENMENILEHLMTEL